MPEFSRSKVINHGLHVNNDKGESCIGYDMIKSRELMVQLGLTAKFMYLFLQWYVDTVHMKEPSGLPGKSDISQCKMREVVMQTAEPAPKK